MSGWLLDTNIISELRKPGPEPKVISFVASAPLDDLYVSIVTLAEIRFGIESVKDTAKRSDWLEHKVRPLFARRVLGVSEDVMLRWRLLVEEGRKAGYTYWQPDLIIAATALVHDLAVVTRDTVEFRRARAPVFNPWQ